MAEEDNGVGVKDPNPLFQKIEEVRQNKAREQGLAHEKGAGAPCLKCKDECPGFDLHYWRKVCNNCRCGREDHDIQDEVDHWSGRIGKLFGAHPALSDASMLPDKMEDLSLENSMYEWIPPGVTAAMVKKYMEALPQEKQPKVGSKGAKLRSQQLETQIPPHDFDPEVCDNLSEKEKKSMSLFVERTKKDVLGVGALKENKSKIPWTCHKCRESISQDGVAVFASKMAKYWHPACFTCSTCDVLLVDLIYFYKDGAIHCGRHYADKHKPRCMACDELIFDRTYTKAEEQNWHIKHFCCWNCDVALAGQHYITKFIKKSDKPYCIACYDDIFGHICQACNEKISAGSRRLVMGEFNWHMNEECFKCLRCQAILLGKHFIPYRNRLYCTSECKREALDVEAEAAKQLKEEAQD